MSAFALDKLDINKLMTESILKNDSYVVFGKTRGGGVLHSSPWAGPLF